MTPYGARVCQQRLQLSRWCGALRGVCMSVNFTQDPSSVGPLLSFPPIPLSAPCVVVWINCCARVLASHLLQRLCGLRRLLRRLLGEFAGHGFDATRRAQRHEVCLVAQFSHARLREIARAIVTRRA